MPFYFDRFGKMKSAPYRHQPTEAPRKHTNVSDLLLISLLVLVEVIGRRK
jgi:hypothetical protein